MIDCCSGRSFTGAGVVNVHYLFLWLFVALHRQLQSVTCRWLLEMFWYRRCAQWHVHIQYEQYVYVTVSLHLGLAFCVLRYCSQSHFVSWVSFFVHFCFLVVARLVSIPMQSIAWKVSSIKWPIVCQEDAHFCLRTHLQMTVGLLWAFLWDFLSLSLWPVCFVLGLLFVHHCVFFVFCVLFVS